MEYVTVHGRKFKQSIPHDEILQAVSRVATAINADYAGKQPLFLSVLNGSFMFTSDLLKAIEFECELSFVRMASYEGTSSTGTVKTLLGVDRSLVEGRDVIVLEDIIDTGNTYVYLDAYLRDLNPASLKIATLLLKPDVYDKDLPVHYAGLEVPNEFLLGYGLDYDGLARNLKDIYVLTE